MTVKKDLFNHKSFSTIFTWRTDWNVTSRFLDADRTIVGITDCLKNNRSASIKNFESITFTVNDLKGDLQIY